MEQLILEMFGIIHKKKYATAVGAMAARILKAIRRTAAGTATISVITTNSPWSVAAKTGAGTTRKEANDRVSEGIPPSSEEQDDTHSDWADIGNLK